MTRKGRGTGANRPALDIRWYQPQALPGAGEGVEIAFLRFAGVEDFHLAVREVAVETFAPHPLTSAPHAVVATGWVGTINGEPLHATEPLDFLDACHGVWVAVAAELLPKFAALTTQATAAQARYRGWDAARMRASIATTPQADPEPGPDPGAHPGGARGAGP